MVMTLALHSPEVRERSGVRSSLSSSSGCFGVIDGNFFKKLLFCKRVNVLW